MPIAYSLLTTFFLILIAVSAAVVVSIVVLALFDLGFGKKNPAKVAEEMENSSSEPVRQRATTPKPKLLSALKLNRRSERQAGCGPESQKVRHVAER
jgi:hypothetical protein